MPSASLIHDEAMKIAASILAVFNLRDDERREAFDAVYDRVKAGLTHYETCADRRDKRLRPITPSEN